jgi:hypothetical protein
LGFQCSRVRGVLCGISSIPLDLARLGGKNHDYGKSVERFGRSRFGFGEVDPWVLFILSCPGYTGLTGALDWSDWCVSLVGFALGEPLVSYWFVWSWFVRFCVGFSFRAGCVLGCFCSRA